MNYKEILAKAIETGKGFANSNFKERATYIKGGCLIKDVHSLNAKMSQMRDEKIVEIYSMLVCEFWNNK